MNEVFAFFGVEGREPPAIGKINVFLLRPVESGVVVFLVVVGCMCCLTLDMKKYKRGLLLFVGA